MTKTLNITLSKYNNIIALVDMNIGIESSNCDKDEKSKFSLRVLLSFCLTFFQFQPGVAYKKNVFIKY